MENGFKTYNEKQYVNFLRKLKGAILETSIGTDSKRQLLFLILKELIKDDEVRLALTQTVNLNQFLNGYDAYLQLEETVNFNELNSLFDVIKQILISKQIFLITKEEFLSKFYNIFMKTEIKPVIVDDSIYFKWENDSLEYISLLANASFDSELVLDRILNSNNMVLYKK